MTKPRLSHNGQSDRMPRSGKALQETPTSDRNRTKQSPQRHWWVSFATHIMQNSNSKGHFVSCCEDIQGYYYGSNDQLIYLSLTLVQIDLWEIWWRFWWYVEIGSNAEILRWNGYISCSKPKTENCCKIHSLGLHEGIDFWKVQKGNRRLEL